eukprot:g5711.t1
MTDRKNITGEKRKSIEIPRKNTTNAQPKFAEKFNQNTIIELKGNNITINEEGKCYASTPPLPVVGECYLSSSGNLGKKNINGDINRAEFKVCLTSSNESDTTSLVEQKNFFAWVNKISRDILDKVWDTEKFKRRRGRLLKQAQQEFDDNKEFSEEESSEEESKKVKERAKSLFISGAKLPGHDRIQLSTLYVNPRTNEVNRPTMWKKNDDTYENITERIDSLTEGSVIIAQMRFRVFNKSRKYGVLLDLGPDIEIVSQREPPIEHPLVKRRRFTRSTSPEEYIERYNGKMVDLLLKLTQSKHVKVPDWLVNPKNTPALQ